MTYSPTQPLQSVPRCVGFEYGVGGSHESYKVRTVANPKWCAAVSCHRKSCTAWHSVRFDAIVITQRV